VIAQKFQHFVHTLKIMYNMAGPSKRYSRRAIILLFFTTYYTKDEKVRISLEHTKKNWITKRMIGRASLTSTGTRTQVRVRGQSLKKPATKYI
jgi:hypothetical protein